MKRACASAEPAAVEQSARVLIHVTSVVTHEPSGVVHTLLGLSFGEMLFELFFFFSYMDISTKMSF